MDKEYVLWMLEERIKILHQRYLAYCNGKNEYGEELSAGVAATKRTLTKQDYNLCLLIKELITDCKKNVCGYLSPEALEGLERLIEPYERHRNLRE